MLIFPKDLMNLTANKKLESECGALRNPAPLWTSRYTPNAARSYSSTLQLSI